MLFCLYRCCVGIAVNDDVRGYTVNSSSSIDRANVMCLTMNNGVIEVIAKDCLREVKIPKSVKNVEKQNKREAETKPNKMDK